MFIDWKNFVKALRKEKDVTAENVKIQIRGYSKSFASFNRFWEFDKITILME